MQSHNSTEKSKSKSRAWLITTVVAFLALISSAYSNWEQLSAKRLADEQRQQIVELQKTTPVGDITAMAAYHSPRLQTPLAHIRNNPALSQQIYNLSGWAKHVPDNGALFMVVHDYGQPTSYFSNPLPHYFITHVTPLNKNGTLMDWKASGVYIGTRSAPSTTLGYRLTLYFCNSDDTRKIDLAVRRRSVQNYGLSRLPYPSCRQLDSIFVTRRPK